MCHGLVHVQLVQHRICVLIKIKIEIIKHSTLQEPRMVWHTHLAETGSIQHDLVNLAHFLQEKVDSGPFKDVKVMPMVLYLDWDDKIRLLNSLNTIWYSM